jgi:hypothetical protein
MVGHLAPTSRIAPKATDSNRGNAGGGQLNLVFRLGADIQDSRSSVSSRRSLSLVVRRGDPLLHLET